MLPLKPDFARTHAFLKQHHRLLINNEWVEPARRCRIEVLNPATGKVLGYAAAGGAEDIDLAVRAARHAFENGPWPACRRWRVPACCGSSPTSSNRPPTKSARC